MIRRMFLVLLLPLMGCTQIQTENVEPPNILFIVWDTTRADHLSLYDYPRETTPELTKFGGEAVVFENAISPGMWTVPSHASLFTGLPVSAHGTDATNKFLDSKYTTMAECFSEANYDTYAFTANPFLGGSTNLMQGFDQFQHPWDPEWESLVRRVMTRKMIPTDASTTSSPKFVVKYPEFGREADEMKDAGKVLPLAVNRWIDSREGDKPW